MPCRPKRHTKKPVHHRYPRDLVCERPAGVEELEAALLAFIDVQVDNAGTTWSLSTHCVVGGVLGHPRRCVPIQPKHYATTCGTHYPSLKAKARMAVLEHEIREFEEAYDREMGYLQTLQDEEPPAKTPEESEENPDEATSYAAGIHYQAWEDWAVHDEMGKASQGRDSRPAMRVKRARLLQSASSSRGSWRMVVDIEEMPKRTACRPDPVPRDPASMRSVEERLPDG